jgi:diguanylate cyclase (GGDEF)-like protein
MPELQNTLLFALCALFYFAALAALFRGRRWIGIGSFFCALGVMHFVETYLASNLFVALPFGIVASPASTVLFSGKLILLLLVYIREDAAVVRQPIYGLLFGNLLIVAMAALLRHTSAVSLSPDRLPDFGFLDQIGGLMVWGTILLFVDSILIILLYERSRAWLGRHVALRLWLCSALVLSFDQAGFSLGLHLMFAADPSVMLGGWVAKMAAAAFYAPLAAGYLRWFETRSERVGDAPRLADVFGALTYRERYEDLLARSRRDALTGLYDRGQLEAEGRRRVDAMAAAGCDVTLLVVDIDEFKRFNDRHGHAAADVMLRRIADSITASVRQADLVFRYGGEEFVVICEDLAGVSALMLGEHLRARIAAMDGPYRVTVSIGIATAPQESDDYERLFALADARLYQAKTTGRNRVVGMSPTEWVAPRRFAESA